MLVENGKETFDIKKCIAEEQNNYYSETLKIDIVCERKLCNSRKQVEQRREHLLLHF